MMPNDTKAMMREFSKDQQSSWPYGLRGEGVQGHSWPAGRGGLLVFRDMVSCSRKYVTAVCTATINDCEMYSKVRIGNADVRCRN